MAWLYQVSAEEVVTVLESLSCKGAAPAAALVACLLVMEGDVSGARRACSPQLPPDFRWTVCGTVPEGPASGQGWGHILWLPALHASAPTIRMAWQLTHPVMWAAATVPQLHRTMAAAGVDVLSC
jgi:hypothetical protein